jgi:hypothetical protein
LALLRPLEQGPLADAAVAQLHALHPEPISRLANGRAPEGVAPSLPGFAPPQGAPADPLAVIAAKQLLKKQAKQQLLARIVQSAEVE